MIKINKIFILGLVVIGLGLLGGHRSPPATQSPDKQQSDSSKITLPDIDISGSPDGIVPLPEEVHPLFKQTFAKYTKIIAPNGKPIHILAQDGWTNDQIKKARNVLEFLLTPVPGTIYGSRKEEVANMMANRKATLVLFNTVDDLKKALAGPLGEKTDLSMQDLRANECPAEGTEDYLNHITRDASLEEIWHLVHDNGVKLVLPEMIAEMRVANDLAAQKGWRAWPEDEPEEHPNEYFGVLLDNYYDLWTVKPKKYEGKPIKDEALPEGTSHFGRYFAGSRAKLKKLDPQGYALIEKFCPPFLTYTAELPASFRGTFSLQFDPQVIYTFKSRHLRNVKLTGHEDANLIGNDADNNLIGNAGNNFLQGGKGDDRFDGKEGIDCAVYSGKKEEYTLKIQGKITVVIDNVSGRDGTDTLINIEKVKFLSTQEVIDLNLKN